MTLNDITMTNSQYPLVVRSTRTNKVFDVVGQLSSGKFVIALKEDDTKVFTVLGTKDRYELATSLTGEPARIIEINDKLNVLNGTVVTLSAQLDDVEAEISTLEDELASLDGDVN